MTQASAPLRNYSAAALRSKRQVLDFIEAFPAKVREEYDAGVKRYLDALTQNLSTSSEVKAALELAGPNARLDIARANYSEWRAVVDVAITRRLREWAERSQVWALQHAERAYFEGALSREELSTMADLIKTLVRSPEALPASVWESSRIDDADVLVALEWDLRTAHVTAARLAGPAD
jgi:hypothetical protein